MNSASVNPGSAKAGWMIPAGLILLTLLPAFGGTIRLIELASDVEITASNARFFAEPIPAILHIIATLTFCIVGAFQFSSSIRRNHPGWHRASGRILIPLGLVSALSGMWMAVSYPPIFGDGTVLTYIRLAVGAAMTIFLCLGFAAIRRRAFLQHRAWMTRGYALGIAAGTQPFTLAPMLAVPGGFTDFTYTLGLSLGWILNICVAEWLIRRTPRSVPVATTSE
jgi:hypothetical protein